jgi:dTDP-4-dehydrorhamnose 3,5-epimerase
VKFLETELEGVWLVDLELAVDDRGRFARCWCHEEFARRGFDLSMVQASLAQTRCRGTLRGLHYQAAPHAEDKFVRCIRGSAWFVALDLRRDSPTHRRWISAELSAENGRALFVPKGCANGYQTLVDDTEVLYMMSEPYHPASAAGVRYNDPAFGIRWPVEVVAMSDRDRNWADYAM